MHLLKTFFVRVGTLLLVLVIALWVIPKFVNLDRHKDSIVSHWSHLLGGELYIEELELVLVPYLGLRASQVKLQIAGDPARSEPFLVTPAAEIRLELRSILTSKKNFDVYVRDADVRLKRILSNRWNVESFFSPPPRAVASPAPSRTPTPNPVVREIEAQAKRLARGEPLNTPTATPHPTPGDQPVRSIPASPLLLQLQFRHLRIDRAHLHFGNGRSKTPAAIWEKCLIQQRSGQWEVQVGRLGQLPQPLASALATCGGSALDTEQLGTTFILSRNGVAIEEWAGRSDQFPWGGRISWAGQLKLETDRHRLTGTFIGPKCETKGQIR